MRGRDGVVAVSQVAVDGDGWSGEAGVVRWRVEAMARWRGGRGAVWWCGKVGGMKQWCGGGMDGLEGWMGWMGWMGWRGLRVKRR